MQQKPWNRTHANAPRPSHFNSRHPHDHALRIETAGRAVDDVVAAFVAIANDERAASAADLWQLAAAARRLDKLALELYQTRKRDF
jgi:hypothetical protein